ncbi:MAG TPA: ABC transporter ATP-binding protein [Bacteroidia bacterium]|nr:ABC transporter ATP-binding protein [Bacteroidia bacterium]HOZ89583.1 ABC transporter ATP-binding protein [Bacteroidia bacterium]HQW18613.1 ABC transporter ATP-binding protein [Bacteroidia bacterium]HQW49716.1 ABC transporter ATP-binding protein [Bacteroidia bacterium]HQX69655.1 ABC transporter ATP-binding protein [Bacteroidia bacterium]
MSIFIENIHKAYNGLKVLQGISLEIKTNELVAIIGPSGAGKSTLLHIIGTIDKPDSGKVLLNNTDALALSSKKLAAFRNKHIGFVFQFHHLLPEFTSAENVMIPAMIAGESESSALKRSNALLIQLGLEQRMHHKPSQLSGGEQQRVAVARALINNPDFILADEPSGNLDSGNAEDLHKLFLKLRNDYKKTIVIVTHNNQLAEMADRTITIRDGLLAQ